MPNTNAIATFAARYSVSPQDAIALPAVFDKAAEIANRPVSGIIADATYSNRRLGEYIAEVARKAAKECRP